MTATKPGRPRIEDRSRINDVRFQLKLTQEERDYLKSRAGSGGQAAYLRHLLKQDQELHKYADETGAVRVLDQTDQIRVIFVKK